MIQMFFKTINLKTKLHILAYCRDGNPKSNTAVSYEDGMVVCLPGYVFTDGNTTHYITCDSPPYWNWNAVPECIKVSFEFYLFKTINFKAIVLFLRQMKHLHGGVRCNLQILNSPEKS